LTADFDLPHHFSFLILIARPSTVVAIHFNLIAIARRDGAAFAHVSGRKLGIAVLTGTLAV
jgi:hypothetical protein